MLLKSESQSISGQSTRTVCSDYDAMGNSTSAIIASPATTATLTRRLAWGQDLAGSPSLQGAGGVGGLLMVEEITSTTIEAYHFHYDGNGNVTEITDHLGASVATYRYDAFGNTLIATGTYAATNRYRFSTKPLDHEVTTAPLYYYGYRYYDPVTGRWPSRDPIEERGGVNLYGFVGNDGVGWIDLFGEMAFRDLDHWVKAKYESEDEDFLFVRLHVKGGCLDWGYGYCSGKVDIFLTVTMWVRNKGRKSDPDTKAIMTGSSNGPWLSFGKASHSFGAHVVTGGGWSKTTTVKVGQADCCGGYYTGDFDVSAARVGSAPSVFYKGNWNLLIKKCGDVANIDVNLWNNYSLAATHPRGFGPATFRIGAPISKDRGTGLDP